MTNASKIGRENGADNCNSAGELGTKNYYNWDKWGAPSDTLNYAEIEEMCGDESGSEAYREWCREYDAAYVESWDLATSGAQYLVTLRNSNAAETAEEVCGKLALYSPSFNGAKFAFRVGEFTSVNGVDEINGAVIVAELDGAGINNRL